ncbi:pentafunctional arom polypeptide [Gossypium australe]|uniref:Pentafunctional arom polypeptide n=1 Tax=Gossypium australe TaxID=47621 RepID=A0A5B6VS29_9ROSI|nr:pentafunctional arom polypeptide [Gossypium australe]
MQTNLFSSMSNGCKKRNRKLVSGYLLSQERERKRKQRQLRHREESLTSQPQRKSKRKEGPLEKLINLGPLHTRAKVFDDRTQRGTNKNGKITDWERKLNWERELEEITKLVTMETKASQCLDDVPMVTKFTGMKASQQILCYIDQIKVQWPMQPDLLVIKQEIQEIDRKYKDAALAEDEAKWRLLLVGGKIEELDRQRSEFYFAPRWPEKVTPTDYRAIMLTCEELLSKFRDLENQLYDKDNNKVEYKDFLGLEQALKKTAWGKTPDYLQTIATRIEKARGKATDVFHIPAQVPICAAIKEMEDFPVEDLDWDTLKKWGATLNYAKKYGFQVGFADNLLSKNLLAYLVIQNLPN